MATAIKFYLRRNSGSVRTFAAVSYDERQTVIVFQDKPWSELMLEISSNHHKIRRLWNSYMLPLLW